MTSFTLKQRTISNKIPRAGGEIRDPNKILENQIDPKLCELTEGKNQNICVET